MKKLITTLIISRNTKKAITERYLVTAIFEQNHRLHERRRLNEQILKSYGENVVAVDLSLDSKCMCRRMSLLNRFQSIGNSPPGE
jgi:hypothetical protein